MNILVKSFIVINLILSCFYCAFQITLFTNRENWKEKYSLEATKSNDEAQKRQAEVSELSEKLNANLDSLKTLEDEKANLSAKNTELETELKEDKVELTKITNELDQLKAAKGDVDEKLSLHLEQLGEARNQLEIAREKASNTSMELQELKAQIVRFEKERNRLQADLEIAVSKTNSTEKKLTEKEQILARLEELGVDINAMTNKSSVSDVAVHAKVLSVKSDADIVLLSVGSNDNVKKGLRFTVFNGATYKGKIQVEMVYPTMSSARIIRGLLAENQTITEGDSASTRIY